ncbi:hypothetical protein NC652_041435 [Populus alba x Populus x berolinensis]|nr:hypothetical protein NC652_041435 [Populus alba x Populus x berolinensis]
MVDMICFLFFIIIVKTLALLNSLILPVNFVKRMPSSPYGCGRRPFHTFSISGCSFAVKPSFHMKTQVNQSSQRLEPRVLNCSSSRKWASMALSISRALKRV